MSIQEPFFAISSRTTLELKTGAWRTMRPLFRERPAPCGAACPAGQDVRGFVRMLAQGDPEGALRVILEDNPLPGVTGRVCHRPCESQCNRGSMDEAVNIRALERAAATYGRVGIEVPPALGKAVAVVGSGPAGLSCAFHLRRAGWSVTVFEQERTFGGLLRTAIPAYRLPKEVLDAELDRFRQMGIEFRGGFKVGRDVSLEELRDSFDAVFLAIGAHVSRLLDISASERVDVTGGLEFLKRVNGPGSLPSPGRVAVLGGGNTALDVARTIKRLGGEPVLCSPEALEAMPALAEEVASSEAEGVRLLTEVVLRDLADGALQIKVRGELYRLEVDQVVAAIGEEVETDWLPDELVADGLVASGPWGETPWEGVFAGGDCVAGERTVAHAIGAGRRVAKALDAYLRGGPLPTEDASPKEVVRAEELNPYAVEPSRAAPVPEVPVEERLGDLTREVLGTLDWPVARTEAERCLGCGTCVACDGCLLFCPDLAVIRVPEGRGYRVLDDYCKGCGVCVTECPTGVLELVREERE